MVASSFDIDTLECSDLSNVVTQMGILLHPPEFLNEKFLIKLRDCVIRLDESHPLKKWLKWVARSTPLSKDDQRKQAFLTEMINTKFNLITDSKTRNEIISILSEIPENTVAEELLKAYLYLMIGNITRSDNYLRHIVSERPITNWQRHSQKQSFYHRLVAQQISPIIRKLVKHPADRRSMELFSLYVSKFYTDKILKENFSDIDTGELEEKMDLKYVEGLAPEFVHFLRFSAMGKNRRWKLLRNIKRFPLREQAYWDWPFFYIDPIISDNMVNELVKIEKEDELWFIYLMHNEKLADLFSKKQKRSFLPSHRPFLKASLKDEKLFMMSLYKLIELGDINQELVDRTAHFLTDD